VRPKPTSLVNRKANPIVAARVAEGIRDEESDDAELGILEDRDFGRNIKKMARLVENQ
jgi:hypothetical protein